MNVWVIRILYFFSMNDKKLANAFKSFVEKVFLPNLKRSDPQWLEWNKFNKVISSETINYEELSNYIDNLNSSSGTTNNFQASFEKKDLPFMRKKVAEDTGSNHNEMAFNPSKTFGG